MNKINEQFNIAVSLDKTCDIIPIVSTFSNSVDIVAKGIFKIFTLSLILLRKDNSTFVKSRYFCHLNDKNLLKCFIYSIPLIGNVVALYFHRQEQYLKKATQDLELREKELNKKTQALEKREKQEQTTKEELTQNLNARVTDLKEQTQALELREKELNKKTQALEKREKDLNEQLQTKENDLKQRVEQLQQENSRLKKSTLTFLQENNTMLLEKSKNLMQFSREKQTFLQQLKKHPSTQQDPTKIDTLNKEIRDLHDQKDNITKKRAEQEKQIEQLTSELAKQTV